MAIREAESLRTSALLPDTTPAVYAFQQNFRTPGMPQSGPKCRTGLVARLRPEAFGNSVFPLQHSSPQYAAVQDDPDPDSPVVMLYKASRPLPENASTANTHRFRDQNGFEHKSWTVTNAVEIERCLHPVQTQQLVLVQGRAQYEAALAAKQEWITAVFLNIDDPGLLLLPRHRVVRNKPDFKTGVLVKNSRAYFFFQEVTRSMPPLGGNGPHFDPGRASELLLPNNEDEPGRRPITAEEAGALISPGSAHNSIVRPGDIVMLAVTRKQTFRLHCQPGWADHVLSHVDPSERNIDVVQLQKIILEGVLELPAENICGESNISYYRDPVEAVREVQRGADVAFIMSTPKVHRLFTLALSDVVLPHNSIELYPSIDGLAIHALC